MGVLTEAIVSRIDSGQKFKAFSWLRDDGTFEAFWHEEGVRVTFFFQCNGKQIGMWKQYELVVGG